MKLFLKTSAIILVVLLVAITGASYYMLDYSLSPDKERKDTVQCFRQLTKDFPEVAPWLDSLKSGKALRDTFVTMPTGEKHHAFFIRHQEPTRKVAIILHGWRDCAIDFFYLARIYHQILGYNVVMPDLHAHGLSEGDAIGMGWQERWDVLHWMSVAHKLFGADDFVIHGVSMGAATTMNVAGEKIPSFIRNIDFVEDCGYTSVWDEFKYELEEEFSLPPFPMLYSTSLMCKLKYGWSFKEASSLKQLEKSHHPMLFIHGDNDHFVPSNMVRPLYDAKKNHKKIWISKGAEHAMSYKKYPQEYANRLQDFLNKEQ